MRTITATVTYKYELQIEDSNSIVREYDSDYDLLVDCASYRFSDTLPVIKNGGVKVIDIELDELS